MATFLKLLGSFVGAISGCVLLAAIRGMLAPLFYDPGLIYSVFAVFGLVGLAIGTVLAAFEKDKGSISLVKANMVGSGFVAIMACIIIFAMMVIPVMNPDQVIEPLSLRWLDAVYIVRGILVIAIPASTGFYLVGRLVRKNNIFQ